MGQFLLFLVVALTVAAVVFGVTVLVTGGDPGLTPVEADGRSVPLPVSRPLAESDVAGVRFDTAVRGYRMAQVDQALRRAAYDIGYKDELIGVLEAEVTALREGRAADADAMRQARRAALVHAGAAVGGTGPVAASAADPAGSGAAAVVADPAAADPVSADSAAAGGPPPTANAEGPPAGSGPADSGPADSGPADSGPVDSGTDDRAEPLAPERA